MKPSDDELASAWLDGELGPSDVAAAEHDDAVRRARQELAAVRRELSEPVPVPAGLREQHIARALDELLGSPSAEADVVALSSRRGTTMPSRRSTAVSPSRGTSDASVRRAVRGASWWMSRAAAAVLVLGGLGAGVLALADQDAPDDDIAASSLAAESTDGGGAADAARAADAAEGEELGALAAPTAPAAGEGADDAAGAVAEEEAAGGDDVSVVATALLDASPEITAEDLALRLVERFGPPQDWQLPGGSGACARSYDDRSPGGAPHLEVPLEQDGDQRALLVPVQGSAVFVDPSTCDRVD